MRRTLCTIALLAAGVVPAAAADSWGTAVKRGDYATAATLLHQHVFEPERAVKGPEPAALKQLALLYAEGKGVTRDAVLACGLLRAHAVAATKAARSGPAARAAQALVEKYCAPLSAADRAAAFAAMTCPRIGLSRGEPIKLGTGWTIQFNDRSATITQNGRTREQALPGDLLCRSQVLMLRHSTIPAFGSRGRARHVIEQVTVQSSRRGGVLTRDLVWQLYEVRGLELDLAAVQRWQEPGSAWPTPALPPALVRGVSYTVHADAVEYEIDEARRGRIAERQ
ncbi:MAG TPA: hypothetical protein VFK57_18425 [Vicinamibacterales bacterium]|nr:hypothetical protein [Vicinamibacterales bacterium]